MPRYEKARSLFGYQDDSGASDTEEEAAAAGVAGFARFGRERRCDERWAQNHSRTCEFIMSIMQRWYNMHSHCFLLYSFSCDSNRTCKHHRNHPPYPLRRFF